MSHTLPRQVRCPGASGVGCDLLPHKRDKVIKCEVKEGIMEQARLCVPTGFGLSFFRVVYFTELEVEVPVRCEATSLSTISESFKDVCYCITRNKS